MKINVTAFAGISIAAAVLHFGVLSSASNPVMFLDSHAIILVLGGTLAAALIAFPAGKLYSLLDFLILGMLFPSKKEIVKVADEIMYLHSLHKTEPGSVKNAQYNNAFIREVAGLLTDTDLTDEEFKKVLVLRSKNILKSYQSDSKILNALAKFPPAFGLLGATTGMIEMMSNLGKGGGAGSIGAAMAVALVATFWGIAIANLILLPLADRAGKMAVDDAHIRDMIIEAAVIIKSNGTDYLLLNTLRGFLPLTQRQNVSIHSSYTSPYSPQLHVVKTNGVQAKPYKSPTEEHEEDVEKELEESENTVPANQAVNFSHLNNKSSNSKKYKKSR